MQFLCQSFLKLSTQYAASETVALSRAVLAMPKIATNR